MKPHIDTTDPEILGTWPALLRAAERARKLAKMTGTPCYVMRDGRIVNLNPQRKRRKTAAKRR